MPNDLLQAARQAVEHIDRHKNRDPDGFLTPQAAEVREQLREAIERTRLDALAEHYQKLERGEQNGDAG